MADIYAGIPFEIAVKNSKIALPAKLVETIHSRNSPYVPSFIGQKNKEFYFKACLVNNTDNKSIAFLDAPFFEDYNPEEFQHPFIKDSYLESKLTGNILKIPKKLIDGAEISDKAFIIPVWEHFQVWSYNSWFAYSHKKKDEFIMQVGTDVLDNVDNYLRRQKNIDAVTKRLELTE